jgi:hypothetical protein
MMAPAHGDRMLKCIAMNEVAFHTIKLDEGHFVAMVLSIAGTDFAVIDILDEDDIDAHVFFMRNAMEDAKRLDAGHAPIHSAESLRRS